jgi:chromosomal replication initiation ATPase DnaA
VPPEVIAFLLVRMERSFAAARSLVELLDRRALAEKRALTVPFVRSVLDTPD